MKGDRDPTPEEKDDIQAVLDVAEELGIKTFSVEDILAAEQSRASRTEWGPWKYLPDNLTLELTDEDGGYLYYLDLERFSTSSEMLDMIFQVEGKTWATDEIIAEMIRALADLLAPQASLCSFGRNLRANPRKILEARQGVPGE